MKTNTIRIKTLADGNRIGALVSSNTNKFVSLENIENLEDGEYNIESFTQVYLAAQYVPEGAPLPTMSNEDCYRYINTDEN